MDWKNLAPLLRSSQKKWRTPKFRRIAIGAKGIWSRAERLALRRSLAPLAKSILILSDIELAHRTAFGGGPGILIVAGTGSAALAVDDRKRRRRRGGLGPLLGDEGSAFWIGRQALACPALSRRFKPETALRLAHARDPVRSIARLAPKVFRWARRDKSARNIMRQAARHLAGMALELSRELHFTGTIPIARHGGLFRDKNFLDLFSAGLKGKRYRLIGRPAQSPEVAAAFQSSR